jgi:methyl-accepting chemotaxis protein
MKLGIRTKLLGSFGIVLALLLAVGILGFRNTTQFASDFGTLYSDQLVTSSELADAQEGLSRLAFGTLSYATSDAAGRAQIKTGEAAFLKTVDDNMKAYAATDMSADEKAAIAQWQTAYPAFLQSRQSVIAAFDAGKTSEATALMNGEATAKFGAANQVINTLQDIQVKTAGEDNARVTSTADVSTKTMLGAILLALVAGFGMALWIANGVTRGVKQVQTTLTSISDNCAASLENALAAFARNDLSVDVQPKTQPIPHFGSDEIGQTAAVTNALLSKVQSMVASYGTARTSLQQAVGEIRRSADSVADSSQQLGSAAGQTGAAANQVAQAIQGVAAGAQTTSQQSLQTNDAVAQLTSVIDGIARGASDQARQVQTASATATQMAAGVAHVANNADTVAAATEQTRAAARQGAEAVRETVTSMGEIKSVVGDAAVKVEDLGQLGERIGAVVVTIDDIAEQTNLLALNAAIEAARAGEHGKGFAVVADEVRKLAERSSRETRQIGDLIQQVQAGTKEAVEAMQAGADKIAQGSARADQAGAALDEILRAVDATVRQVTDIASASQEMAVGARSVTDAMHSISAVIEENTAATEEMAAQSGEVGSAIQSIAAVAEEQSAATEEISAGAEEMNAQVEEMSAQAQELAATADQLRSLVARFKLDTNKAAVNNVVPLRRAA